MQEYNEKIANLGLREILQAKLSPPTHPRLPQHPRHPNHPIYPTLPFATTGIRLQPQIAKDEKLIVRNIKTEKYVAKEEPEACTICQQEFKDSENVSNLSCNHLFHSQCVRKWLEQKSICPVCRAQTNQ
ncbi:hypothetical protein FGO68_gene1360 [Halteria grandinella]|uniref:RING-type E3 ubiquitin transferase n=1 Tax=Halteria grandinella TaxID=5974 RepID=A0A8J8SW07_HALGN|nr:hypothetical protein FGO68_gene1360 [Halteria grandinella]